MSINGSYREEEFSSIIGFSGKIINPNNHKQGLKTEVKYFIQIKMKL